MLPSDFPRYSTGKGVVSVYIAIGGFALVCFVVAVCALRRDLYMDRLKLCFMKVFNFEVSVKEKCPPDCGKQSEEHSPSKKR